MKTLLLCFSASVLACLGASAWAQTAPAAKAAAQREQFKKEVASSQAAPLPPELIALAERVQTGRIPCELGHNVALLPDPAAPGYFIITTGKERYRLVPVPTTTGAIRLEDKARGGVWLQLANKSMLLDEKNGKRLADECMSPAQKQFADGMKTAPPPSILGALPGTVPNAEPLPQASASDASSTAPATTPAASPAAAPAAPLNLNLPPR
jgi:hypothetical protein